MLIYFAERPFCFRICWCVYGSILSCARTLEASWVAVALGGTCTIPSGVAVPVPFPVGIFDCGVITLEALWFATALGGSCTISDSVAIPLPFPECLVAGGVITLAANDISGADTSRLWDVSSRLTSIHFWINIFKMPPASASSSASHCAVYTADAEDS